jgi:hypothetical protein
MHVILIKEKSNQGTIFSYEPNQWWLSLHLPKIITLDMYVHFGKSIPHWKDKLRRNTIEQVLMAKFGYNIYRD